MTAPFLRALFSVCATWLSIHQESVEPPDIFGMAKVFYAIVNTKRDIGNEIMNVSVKDGVWLLLALLATTQINWEL